MSKNIRLSMNLLVKNEEDIIADNIKVHAKLGVDCFVVMDNGSTDTTREILDSLKQDYEMLIIDRPEEDYQQSNWKTEMAVKSRKILKADWSIANDADEFWLPEQGGLKDDLNALGSVVYCPRYNMQLDQKFHSETYKFYHSDLQVECPIDIKGADIIQDDHLSIMMGKIHGKVMVNNFGLLRVKGGNHRAWHLWGKLNSRSSKRIKVFHYPIRSKKTFEENIVHRKKLLEKGVKKMGNHYRRWVRLYEQGKLDEEYDRLIPAEQDVAVLKKYGVLKKNDFPRIKLTELLESD